MFNLIQKLEKLLSSPIAGETRCQKIARQHNFLLLHGNTEWFLCDEKCLPIATFPTDYDAITWINKRLTGN